MENEVSSTFTPNLPPSPTNWLKVLLFTMLGLVVLAGSMFVGIQIGKNQAPDQQPVVVNPTVSSTQVDASPTIAPTSSPIIDLTTNWKTYISAKYTFRYPSEWIVDEKCTKLGHPASNPCVYSSDYEPVTKKIEPGDGGEDTVTEYNVGTLLNIDLLENVAYDSNGFCSPGGPASIDNCHEKTINGNIYALREIGRYPYPTTSINAWLLKNNNGVVNLSYFFSKKNKVADIQLFDQILASFKLIN